MRLITPMTLTAEHQGSTTQAIIESSITPTQVSKVVHRSQRMFLFSAIALFVLSISQLGSYLVNTLIPIGSTVEWSKIIHLTHIRNMGGVFGMFQGRGWIFALFSVGLVVGLVVYLVRGRQVQFYEYLCFGFIAGGGASNILDRLIYGSVVDFINIQGIPYWHYIFNTADVMVHVGLWPMLYLSVISPTPKPKA